MESRKYGSAFFRRIVSEKREIRLICPKNANFDARVLDISRAMSMANGNSVICTQSVLPGNVPEFETDPDIFKNLYRRDGNTRITATTAEGLLQEYTNIRKFRSYGAVIVNYSEKKKNAILDIMVYFLRLMKVERQDLRLIFVLAAQDLPYLESSTDAGALNINRAGNTVLDEMRRRVYRIEDLAYVNLVGKLMGYGNLSNLICRIRSKIDEAENLLNQMGALAGSRLTPIGGAMASLSMDVRLSGLVFCQAGYRCRAKLIQLSAMLYTFQNGAAISNLPLFSTEYSDHLALINVYDTWLSRPWEVCHITGVSMDVYQKVAELHQYLTSCATSLHLNTRPGIGSSDDIRRGLLTCFSSNIAKLQLGGTYMSLADKVRIQGIDVSSVMSSLPAKYVVYHTLLNDEDEVMLFVTEFDVRMVLPFLKHEDKVEAEISLKKLPNNKGKQKVSEKK